MTTEERTYDDAYGAKESPYEATRGLTAFPFRKLRRFETNRYQSCLDMITPTRGKLLDVGCGDSEFLLMARSSFKECYGVDISAA